MIDTQANPRSYIKMMVVVTLLGIATAVMTFLFIAISNQGIDVIWKQALQPFGISRAVRS